MAILTLLEGGRDGRRRGQKGQPNGGDAQHKSKIQSPTAVRPSLSPASNLPFSHASPPPSAMVRPSWSCNLVKRSHKLTPLQSKKVSVADQRRLTEQLHQFTQATSVLLLPLPLSFLPTGLPHPTDYQSTTFSRTSVLTLLFFRLLAPSLALCCFCNKRAPTPAHLLRPASPPAHLSPPPLSPRQTNRRSPPPKSSQVEPQPRRRQLLRRLSSPRECCSGVVVILLGR